MKAILVLAIVAIAHFAAAQVHMEFPPQHKGDTTVYAYPYNLVDSILRCDSCFLDLRTVRKNVVECATEVTSSSSPVQLTATCFDNLINQGITPMSCTFMLPESPVNGQICRLVFNNAVTTMVIADSVFTYKFYTEASTWKRIQ
jgi:hypothetical protein